MATGTMTLPISVIIPNYCRPHLCAQALRSVYLQSSPPTEIYLIDDASGASFQILQELIRQVIRQFPQSPIQLYTHSLQRHWGMPGAVRNVGILKSRQPWLAFLDSDDVWLPHKLECQWQWVEQSGTRLLHSRELWLRFTSPPSSRSPADTFLLQRMRSVLPEYHKQLPDWCKQFLLPPCHAVQPLEIQGRVISQKTQKQCREGTPEQLWPDAVKKCILGPSTLLMHRSLCQKAGYFDPHLQIAEDYEYFLRLIACSDVAYCPEYLIAKRDSIPKIVQTSPESSLETSQSQCETQLSHLYPWIEPYRIAALERFLASPHRRRLLSATKFRIAHTELCRKLDICLRGAKKRYLTNPSEGLSREILHLQSQIQHHGTSPT